MNNANTISPDTFISRNESKFLANSLGDELVMMNMQNGDFISMNRVGADIWNFLAVPMTVKQLVAELLNCYTISEQQCLEETVDFLKSSLSQQLFILSANKAA